ncbi:hypothetical protein ACK2M7_12575 [Chryseobacterium sp. TY4]
MSKVSINIIKEWFKNQSKPPQEQFWAWMDSFWHKDEPIPMSAVTNLEDRLSKKADLVKGKVPKEQLPFTVETSEIIALGAVTATSSTVSLAVHSGGSNKVRLGGNIRERAFASNFNYTPVVTGVKVLLMYAIDDEFIFYLAEGIESAEAVEPELPSGALYIRRIIVNVEGPVIDTQVLSGFREKAVDGWKTHFASSAAPAYLVLDNSHKCNFSVVQLSSTSEVNIAGIYTNVSDLLYDGLQFTITNDCATDINLVSQAAGSNQKAFVLPRSPFKVKSGQSIKLYYSAAQDAVLPLLLSSDAPFTFATQPEMESQTPPDTENNKAVSLFGLWKWLQKLTKLYITPTTGTALERYRLRVRQSNGRLAYVGADDIERDIAWSSDLSAVITSTFNPPTQAQLTSLGLKRGDFYQNTTTNQRAMYNGNQLVEWTVTTAEYNALSIDQKNAVKNLSIVI